jgi:hypothetical protein
MAVAAALACTGLMESSTKTIGVPNVSKAEANVAASIVFSSRIWLMATARRRCGVRMPKPSISPSPIASADS